MCLYKQLSTAFNAAFDPLAHLGEHTINNADSADFHIEGRWDMARGEIDGGMRQGPFEARLPFRLRGSGVLAAKEQW